MELNEIIQTDYHRNGVSGAGFYAIRAMITVDGKMRPFLIIRLDKEADAELGGIACFVLCEDKLPDVRFFHNSWRGDHFAEIADECIARHREQWKDGTPKGFYD